MLLTSVDTLKYIQLFFNSWIDQVIKIYVCTSLGCASNIYAKPCFLAETLVIITLDLHMVFFKRCALYCFKIILIIIAVDKLFCFKTNSIFKFINALCFICSFVLSLADVDPNLMMEDESMVWTSNDVVIVLEHQNEKIPLR